MGVLALIIGTVPIWVFGPLSALGLLKTDYFPRVTLLSLPDRNGWTVGLELTAFVALICSLLTLLIRGEARWAWAVTGISLVGLVLFDQVRLQPWVYQTMVYAIIIACLGFSAGRHLMLPVAISVYVFSAVGKLDYQFTHTVGNQLVRTLFSPVVAIEDGTATRMALALPIGELAVGILLIFRRTRKAGGIAAMALHITLIGLFGPWSLNHSFGVLLWNLLLVGQAWLLFLLDPGQSVGHGSMTVRRQQQIAARFFCTALIVIVCTMPLTERRGYWDHWMSWALYSPHNSRTTVQIHRSAINQIDPSLVKHLNPDSDDDGWRDLDWSAWSLESRWVPIYPQARYQLVAALETATHFDLSDAIRARLKEASDRWTGQRAESYLLGRSEMAKATDQFMLVPSRETWE